jgi:hypothetical protein
MSGCGRAVKRKATPGYQNQTLRDSDGMDREAKWATTGTYSIQTTIGYVKSNSGLVVKVDEGGGGGGRRQDAQRRAVCLGYGCLFGKHIFCPSDLGLCSANGGQYIEALGRRMGV